MKKGLIILWVGSSRERTPRGTWSPQPPFPLTSQKKKVKTAPSGGLGKSLKEEENKGKKDCPFLWLQAQGKTWEPSILGTELVSVQQTMLVLNYLLT